MKQEQCTPLELRVTAALYARVSGVVEHVRAAGTLPADMKGIGGGNIGARVLMQQRGPDFPLDADEQLVYDAIVREGRLPAGSVMLPPGCPAMWRLYPLPAGSFRVVPMQMS
jgi:hypothetical protein